MKDWLLDGKERRKERTVRTLGLPGEVKEEGVREGEGGDEMLCFQVLQVLFYAARPSLVPEQYKNNP